MKDNKKAGQNNIETVGDVYEVALLLDFYGQLLTERQYEIMDLHYNSDLSLGEIAEVLGISRQGVHDSIQKARNTLESYEKRLRLAERFREQERDIEKALNNLKALGESSPELLDNNHYRTAVRILDRLLETL